MLFLEINLVNLKQAHTQYYFIFFKHKMRKYLINRKFEIQGQFITVGDLKSVFFFSLQRKSEKLCVYICFCLQY